MKLQYIYQYDAFTYQGEYCSGKLIATSKHDAFIKMMQQQKTPLKIKLYKAILLKESDSQYRIQLLEQLSLLIHSGLALLPALTLLKNECRYLHWQCVLDEITYNLAQGSTFSKQLSLYPFYFPPSLTYFIYIAEESGKLDEIITSQASQLKSQKVLINKTKKALKYPIFLVFVLIITTTIMLLYVLPEYQSLYSSFNTDLPLITSLLITISQWIINNSLIIISLLISLIISYYCARVYFFSFYLAEQQLLIRTPYIGILLKYHQLQLIFQILTITQQAGLPLLKGLNFITEQLTHPLYQRALSQMIEHVTQGKSLSSFMKHEPLFPPICHQFIISAENSGQLLFFCQKLNEWFNHQFEERLNTLNSWLEPILMTVIALIVGTLIIAMYLPILQLGDIIR
ncbi:PilC family type IV fimbrial assembly protein [Proteus hauseri ATCC 700826]|uniref:PilC family type IV fimbrial assembly protein n=1 Tax=Proteus hauseri ATCC 700826 TaxID=1354271 RepID=A0AAJ3LSX3_PROHU|nr:type II secretion system F family protein [Proteus hauseri]OAT45630.1 PilC family type IV fimbrial assembly protein [Proteus hauseri ATCC 700826]